MFTEFVNVHFLISERIIPLLVTCCKQISALTVYPVTAAMKLAELANANVHYIFKRSINLGENFKL
jgi:hypothetical protein